MKHGCKVCLHCGVHHEAGAKLVTLLPFTIKRVNRPFTLWG